MNKLFTRRKLLRSAALAAPALILPSRRLLARSMHGGGGGGGGYVAKAVHLDGATSLLIESLAAPGDSTGYFSGSFWFKSSNFGGSSGFGGAFWAADPASTGTPRASTGGPSPNTLTFAFGSPTGENLNLEDCPINTIDVWDNVLVSVQTNSDPKVIQVYLNDSPLSGSLSDFDPAFLMQLDALPFELFDNGFSKGFVGDVADPWVAPGQYIDFSIEANRRKFISATGKPVYLGASGELATGTAPAIFFSGNATTFATNQGTGGAFTLTGALTNATTSPSD